MGKGADGLTQPGKAERISDGAQYRHPMEVAYHARLPTDVKRTILAHWAADSNALADASFMRRDPRTGLIASVDQIAEALQALDEEAARRARALCARTDPAFGAIPTKDRAGRDRGAKKLARISASERLPAIEDMRTGRTPLL
jgi:hypothetical protein